MTNNDILRRLRYTFDLNDKKMIALFALGASDVAGSVATEAVNTDSEEKKSAVTREQISDWLKKEDDPAHKNCSDTQLATFLNGFINHKRGKKEGEQPVPESRINNNIVFRKLKIALDLKSDDVIEIMDRAGLDMSKHELSAFFRKQGHKHYRECKDQIMRNFLQGLQLKYRPSTDGKEPFKWDA